MDKRGPSRPDKPINEGHQRPAGGEFERRGNYSDGNKPSPLPLKTETVRKKDNDPTANKNSK